MATAPRAASGRTSRRGNGGKATPEDLEAEIARLREDVARLAEQLARTGVVTLCFPDPRHRRAPAIRILRQPHVLAQLPALLQMRDRRVHVVVFDRECGDAYMHVRRSSQQRAPAPRVEPESSRVDLHRLV